MFQIKNRREGLKAVGRYFIRPFNLFNKKGGRYFQVRYDYNKER